MAWRHDPWILVLNAGSSSLKFAAYPLGEGEVLAAGQVAAIGAGAELQFAGAKRAVPAAGHEGALAAVLATLSDAGFGKPAAAGHRVVHGGAQTEAARISPAVRQAIVDAATLAPLHNPPALAVIDALAGRFPSLEQVACFDTAFHASNPPEATTIPVPAALRAKGIRRYGFHGLSYASLVRRFSGVTGQPLPHRLLACHLGAGSSLAAIVDGQGVATTMGFSPMDGLVMATRAGAMDSGVLLHLLKNEGFDADSLERLLNRESGLLALGGCADMEALLESPASEAAFAVTHYCYWAARHAGSMIAAMGGVDGIVFTGGIGENAPRIRDAIAGRLEWCGIGPENTRVVPADEEGEIAHSVRRICAGIA